MLTVIGFILGPILLILILPLIVDEDDKSIHVTNERKSQVESDESSSLIDENDEEDFV